MIIRTNHDTQTNYLYAYSNELIEEAEKRFKVVKIEGKDINEKVIRSRIKNRRPNFIFFNGHGSKTCLFDNDKKSFIDINSSDIFKETVTFARACDCLDGLGKSAIENGCKSFIGYRKKFWIARHHEYECTPLRDYVARPVIECSNIIVKELIKSKTVDEAIKKSHEKSADYILELVYSKEPLAIASLQAIIANDSTLDFEGGSSATIC